MNRPYLVNFSAIASDSSISIKATISDSPVSGKSTDQAKIAAPTPIQSIKLFSKNFYRIKVQGLSSESSVIYDKDFDTDDYGIFTIKISELVNGSQITKLRLYEISALQSIQVHLGSLILNKIQSPKKIIISDFDKTLVETKYATIRELYSSLSKPLSHFPTIAPSLDILKSYISKDFQPFILSASPHFYEKSIRDWLYQNEVFASSIFLKDYRDFISLFSGDLSRKDLTSHGYYKLNQLVEILLMTGLPKNLVLIGDGFESDPFIYLTLSSLIKDKADPWALWKSIKNNKIFSLNNKQDSYFLTKFYRLSEMSRKVEDIDLEIYIRATTDNIDRLRSSSFTNRYVDLGKANIHYYVA